MEPRLKTFARAQIEDIAIQCPLHSLAVLSTCHLTMQ